MLLALKPVPRTVMVEPRPDSVGDTVMERLGMVKVANPERVPSLTTT
jgi:hypothetical protein